MKTRLFVSRDLINGAEAVLDGDQARYLGRVLRLRVGDELVVFDGAGTEWSATVAAMTRSTATIELGATREVRTESPLKIHLVQGISRGERMDFVVQKATELGVDRITPVLTEYGVVKLDERRAAKRRDHWQGVAASACEQAGRTRLPLIDTPLALKAWFGSAQAGADVSLVLTPGAALPLVDVAAPRTSARILIGPEGGFSATECEDAEIAGFRAVRLGPRTLRTETAALAALAVMQASWGDLA
jgi:16S rRNA (uracil1498-N3)-methyltransferase